MEIVSSDDHDTFDDVEGDFDEDQNQIASFIASEHVSLTEEWLTKHESALKVKKSSILSIKTMLFKSLNLILDQLGCECDNDKGQDLLSTISTLETAVKNRLPLKTEESENNSEILENPNDLLDTNNITDEKLILEVQKFYL